MANEATNGLASVAQVEALADQLSQCADALHARIMRDLLSQGPTPGDAAMGAARALFNDELVLRQRANALYADAATSVVKGLAKSEQDIATLTATAAAKIAQIARIQDVTGLVGSLLLLAGAAATGQVLPIAAAFDKVRVQVNALHSLSPA